MVTIKVNRRLTVMSSPYWVGLMVFLALLTGCKPADTPEDVTVTFWQAMAANDIKSIRAYTLPQTPPITQSLALPELQESTFKTGQIVINHQNATVDTLIASSQHKEITLQTFLVKQGDTWKVDYQRTLNQMRLLPFNDFFKGLEALGGVLNEQLEQGLEQFGQSLKKQLDQFGQELQKNLPKKRSPTDDTI